MTTRAKVVIEGMFKLFGDFIPEDTFDELEFSEELEHAVRDNLVSLEDGVVQRKKSVKLESKKKATFLEDNPIFTTRNESMDLDDESFPSVAKAIVKAMGGTVRMTPQMVEEIMKKTVFIEKEYENMFDVYDKNPLLLEWVKERWAYYYSKREKLSASRTIKTLMNWSQNMGPEEYVKKKGMGQIGTTSSETFIPKF